jgi:hypothetical protein
MKPGMQYQAFLSRAVLEAGAALVVTGNRLATQDTLKIGLAGKKQPTTAVVSAFGLGRLVLTVGSQKVELGPWLSGHDTPPDAPAGPVSKWTIRTVEAG